MSKNQVRDALSAAILDHADEVRRELQGGVRSADLVLEAACQVSGSDLFQAVAAHCAAIGERGALQADIALWEEVYALGG